jgi:hypothetical protein
VIVSGCGRSGTHLIGHIMEKVFGPEGGGFEPGSPELMGHVAVDSRLRHRIHKFDNEGHRIVHLVRDGRDVVRSLHHWYNGGRDFGRCCNDWSEAVDMMAGYDVLHLEDLSSAKVRDARSGHNLPHWEDWDPKMTEEFWRICGEQMAKMGYGR